VSGQILATAALPPVSLSGLDAAKKREMELRSVSERESTRWMLRQMWTAGTCETSGLEGTTPDFKHLPSDIRSQRACSSGGWLVSCLFSTFDHKHSDTRVYWHEHTWDWAKWDVGAVLDLSLQDNCRYQQLPCCISAVRFTSVSRPHYHIVSLWTIPGGTNVNRTNICQ
jgi:hypothetical protein